MRLLPEGCDVPISGLVICTPVAAVNDDREMQNIVATERLNRPDQTEQDRAGQQFRHKTDGSDMAIMWLT